MAALPPSRSLRERAGSLFRLALAIVGVLAVVLLIRQVGARELLTLAVRALPWIPLLLLLEGLRILSDTLGTRAICADEPKQIDLATWIRMHLVANSALVMLPAGRAICEGVKIASMSKVYGAPRAAGYVVMQHSMTLLALALISIPCAAASYLAVGMSMLTIAMAVHCVLCVIGMFAVQAAARRAVVPKFAKKWFVHSDGALLEFRDVARAVPRVHIGTLLGKLGNRVLQAAQFGVILYALGAHGTTERAFLADGVNLVGSALGELLPAQIGAMDGTFAIASKALLISIAAAMAIANLSRLVQLGWSAVGALLPVISPDRPRDASPSQI
jgi:hypothetical protein